ncbi:MAG: hypothetical protein JKY93_00150, partial [Gammaproteobacteria bacterium]|nr:hypothetical protein [Gammaproteobacteria bacterium]
IKFDEKIQTLSVINIKGAQLIKKEEQYVLIWMAIPAGEKTVLTLKTANLIKEVGTVFYLVEGEMKTKKIEPENGTIAMKTTSLKSNHKQSNLPLAYQQLDLNKDDKISAKEVSNAVDLFFDGEIDFSQKELYEMINFFFDQK